MNILIAKKAAIYSLILGAVLAVFGLLGFLIGLVAFVLSLLAAPSVILALKLRNEIGFLDNQQGALLGAMCGATATLAFFALFSPLVLIIHKINEGYYSYGLPYLFTFDSLWLLIVIIIMIALLLALTNATTGMGAVFAISQFEKKPEDLEQIDISIE